MPTIAVMDMSGKQVGTMDLSDAVFAQMQDALLSFYRFYKRYGTDSRSVIRSNRRSRRSIPAGGP